MKVPLCKMYNDDKIKQVVLDVLDSGKYVNGPQAEEFEKEFSRYIKVKKAISVNSGTSALFITLMAMGIKPGDEVIVPSHTFIASISQAVLLGAKPIFAEIDPNNYTLDIEDVKSKITDRTKAIIAVHIYGHPVNMDPLMELASKYDIKVIEDCAQSHGSMYKGKKTGSLGHYGCFSFFPSKIMSVVGDGGMILTNDEELAEKMDMLKNHGRKKKYVHEMFGMNMRMSEIPAAIGRVQLQLLPQFMTRRNKIVKRYNQSFSRISEIKLQKTESWADPIFYLYVIRIKDRNNLVKYLKENGISTGIHYPIPLHQQPIIEKNYGKQSLPITEEICKTILSIPLSAAMLEEEVNYVIERIENYFNN